jgi:hypothetical protein
MPISLNCSECGVTLKVPDKLAGKTGKCPKCAAIIVVPASLDEVEDKPSAASATVRKTSQGVATAPAKMGKSVVPAADEDDEAPAQPKKASNGIATAPAKAGRTVTVADEDRADPDAGTDERPRHRRSKKPPKKSGLKMVLILGAVACLLLFGGLALAGGIGGFLWWRASRSSSKSTEMASASPAPSPAPSPGPLADELKYFPNNTQVIFTARADQMRNCKLYTDVKTDLGAVVMEKLESTSQEQYGFPQQQVEQVVVAGAIEDEAPIIIVRLSKAIQASDIVATLRKKSPQATFAELKVGSKTIYEPAPNVQFGANIPGMSFCVDGNYVLLGKSGVLRLVIERDKAAELPEKMKTAMKTVDFNKSMVLVIAGIEDKRANNPGNPNDVPVPETVTAWIHMDKDIVGSATITYKDAATADRAKTKMVQGIDDMKRQVAFKDVPSDLMEYTIKLNGRDLILDGTIKGSTVSKLIRKLFENGFNQGIQQQQQPVFPPGQPGQPPGVGGPGIQPDGPGRPPFVPPPPPPRPRVPRD